MQHVTYPLLSDRNHRISRSYGVLNEEKGTAMRSTVIINPEGRIEAKLVYPSQVGRNTTEIVRILEAVQFSRQSNLGAPANWVPGKPGIPIDISHAGKI